MLAADKHVTIMAQSRMEIFDREDWAALESMGPAVARSKLRALDLDELNQKNQRPFYWPWWVNLDSDSEEETGEASTEESSASDEELAC